MAGVCGEVLTLQLGHYANFVGAHWWNLQGAELSQQSDRRSWDPEICSDVLFRRGVTLQGAETYTPRLIVLDVRGSPRSVREEGWLYEDREKMRDTPAWTGAVTIHEEEAGSVTEPGLEEGGAVMEQADGACGGQPPAQISQEAAWGDLLRTPLHPRSLCVLERPGHGGDALGPRSFGQGEALFQASSQLEEVEDRLHFFTEECDYLQGFQILCDLNSGFSGAGARMAELLHDEYPGRGILSFGTCHVPPGERDPRTSMYQLLNCILALGALSSHSSALCPLTVHPSLGRRPGPPATFPYLLYDAGWQSESSAVLALALDTLTSPYRLSGPGLSMSQLAESLNVGGRKVLAASGCVPFPVPSSASLPETLLSHLAVAPWRSLSPCVDDGDVFAQSVVLRGISRQSGCRPGAGVAPSLYTCASGAEVLQQYLSTLYPRTLSASHVLQTPASLGATFPPIFSPCVTRDGYIGEGPRAAAVGHIPVMAALQASAALRQSLRGLCDEVSATDIRRWVNAQAAGIELEHVKETVDELRSLAQCYGTREEETEDSD